MNTKFCVKCGRKIPVNYTFCKYCGAKQPAISIKGTPVKPKIQPQQPASNANVTFDTGKARLQLAARSANAAQQRAQNQLKISELRIKQNQNASQNEAQTIDVARKQASLERERLAALKRVNKVKARAARFRIKVARAEHKYDPKVRAGRARGLRIGLVILSYFLVLVFPLMYEVDGYYLDAIPLLIGIYILMTHEGFKKNAIVIIVLAILSALLGIIAAVG